MTEGGTRTHLRLVDRRAHTRYEKYGRLAAVVVAVVLVGEVVRLTTHPRVGDALGLVFNVALAGWFFWPLYRDRRDSDGVIVVSPRYVRTTWIAVSLVVAVAVVTSLAVVI